MKVYEFYWEYYEEYRPRLFTHTKSKTKAQWKADCVHAMREVGESYISSADREWVGADGWFEAAAARLSTTGYGYVPVVPTTFGLFGGTILGLSLTGRDMLAPAETAFKKLVGDRLFEMALAKNRKTDNELEGGHVKNEAANNKD